MHIDWFIVVSLTITFVIAGGRVTSFAERGML